MKAFSSLYNLVRSQARVPNRRAERRPPPSAGLRIERLEDRLLLNAGSLDPRFGTGGLVNTSLLTSANDSGQAVAVQQSDGKIVMAGVSRGPFSVPTQWALARYNLDGTLDNSFGTGGKATFGFGTSQFDDQVGAIAVQADGKIVVAGTIDIAGGIQFALTRFNANGAMDSSFGTGGTVVSNLSGGGQGFGEAIQPDGKIIVVGETFFPATRQDFAVLRYNANGTLDPTFGSGGLVTTDFSTFNDVARSVVLQPDGRILVAGPSSGDHLVRYNADGSLDATFGTNGKVNVGNGSIFGVSDVRALALQPNGQILVAGTAFVTTNNGFYDFAISRYNVDGSLDANFGSSGTATVDLGSRNDRAQGLAVQTDGKIVVMGTRGDANNEFFEDFAVARFNANGTLDATFGGTGKVLTDFGGPNEQAHGVVLASDGKIVVAGTAQTPAGGFDFALARYNPSNGSLDGGFGNGGLVTTDFLAPSNDFVAGVAVQADGKVVVAGTAIGPAQEVVSLVRYNLDGSLDSSFASGGEVTTNLGVSGLSNGASAAGVVIQTDGKIVVAATSQPSHTMELVRFNSDGSMDQTFGTAGIAVAGFAHPYLAEGLAIQSDGKLILEGISFDSFLLLARFDTSGHLDPTFAGTGLLTTHMPLSSNGIVAMEPDGKILAGGGNFLTRFNPDGSTDVTYGAGGTTSVPYLNLNFRMGLAFQADGKLIISGAFAFALVRLNKDGSLDTHFGNNGFVSTNPDPSGLAFAFASDVAVQGDQRIIAAGLYNGNLAFVRYLPSGRLDPIFGQGGIVTTNIMTPFGDARLALKPDGKIVAAGTGFAANGLVDFTVVQLVSSPGAADLQTIQAGLTSATAAAASQPAVSGSLVTADEAAWVEDMLLALGSIPSNPQTSFVSTLVMGSATVTFDTLFTDLDSIFFAI
jgi:uncharacterized delta-60 repeat protein